MVNKYFEIIKKFILAFSVLIIIFVGYFLVISGVYSKHVERGLFGDMFGGLNALFSGLAFAGVVYAILLQREDLHLQRKELELTREELKRSATAQEKSEKALSKTAKLNALAAMLNHEGNLAIARSYKKDDKESGSNGLSNLYEYNPAYVNYPTHWGGAIVGNLDSQEAKDIVSQMKNILNEKE